MRQRVQVFIFFLLKVRYKVHVQKKGPAFTFLSLSSVFVLSQFYRTSLAVISVDLLSEIALDAQELGNLGAAFFYSFALLQIPVGILLDRFGPRCVMSFLCAIGSFGSFLFAYGKDYHSLLLARVLQGVGMSAGLMGSLKAFSMYFPQSQFSTLSGLLLSIGTLGNILSSSPLAYLSQSLGWRKTFTIFGMINFVISILVFIALPGQREIKPTQAFEKGIKKVLEGILRTLSFWQIGVLAFFRYGTFVAMQGLWFGPYLINVKGFDPILTGNLLLVLSIGIISGSVLSGYATDRFVGSPKRTVLIGVPLYTLTIVFFTGIFNIDSKLAYSIILFFCGFFNSFGILLYSHVKNLFPSGISGTVMSSVNLFTMAGGATFMYFMGHVIRKLLNSVIFSESTAYHFAFMTCLFGCALGLLFYSFSKERLNGGKF